MAENDVKIKIAKIFSYILTLMCVIFLIPSAVYGWSHSPLFSNVILSSGVVIILSTFGLLLNPKRYLIFGLLIMIFSILAFCVGSPTSSFGNPLWVIVPGLLFMLLGVSVGFLTILHEKKS